MKTLQVVDIPSLDEAKRQANGLLRRDDIEIITISHQYADNLLSILVHYRKKS